MIAADVTMPSTALSVAVWRGGADGAYRRYDVPRLPAQTVLDVVTHIQRRLDPTLAYRFACRVGMCGSCAMTVNGRARWTCRTHVDVVAPDGALEIGPLAHLPVISDLVVDMAPFFDKWAQAKGAFAPTATRADDFARIEPASPARRAVDAAIECIGCGVCHASCDVVAWNPDYLGPARAEPRVDAGQRSCATARAARGCRRSRATPAATRATRTRAAPSVARSASRPRPRSPA